MKKSEKENQNKITQKRAYLKQNKQIAKDWLTFWFENRFYNWINITLFTKFSLSMRSKNYIDMTIWDEKRKCTHI